MANSSLLFALLGLLVSFIQAAHGAEGSTCRTLKLSEKTVNGDRVYSLNETVLFRFAYDNALNKLPGDYGARLMLLKRSQGAYTRSYYSKGSGDSYGIRPTFVANCGRNELLILGEIGTEYSWGLRVFSYNNGKVEDLGTIPLAVEGQFDAESVVPFMRFSQKDHSAIVSFTKDLIRNPGSPNEQSIPKSKVKYRIDRNKLTEIHP